MQQHLRRQDGVVKVDVALETGKVAVELKDDTHFDPAAMLKAVYDSGVTVYEMNITATGRLRQDAARGLLFEASSKQVFEVKAGDVERTIENLAGTETRVTLRGRLYRKPSGKQKPKFDAPLRLEILEVLKKEPAS